MANANFANFVARFSNNRRMLRKISSVGSFLQRVNIRRALSGTRAVFNASDAQDSRPPPMGCIYDKKPVKLELEEGKLYSWCTCGSSKKQPFCDNSHRSVNDADPDKSHPPFRSHKFQVDKKKDYFLCMCKQTLNRPFCDGTHKKKEIQDVSLNKH